MELLTKIKRGEEKVAVVGLGYVGLPLAVAFGKKIPVIGFDINERKIINYKKNCDETNEVDMADFLDADVEYTCDPQKLRDARFHIVAVPTPIDKNCRPDLSPVISASKVVGKNLASGSIVVYESTVYPGVTEEICVPILEKESGLICGIDFFVGYSPERINPGDKEHTVSKIVKVVAGQNVETLNIIAGVYELAITAGIHKAPSIKVAEAAKVIENTQRDLNIAFMNELSIIFDKMEIDTQAVLEAAGTKWNFLNFKPGLVGGHCIGVDPYYLTFKAEEIGYHPEVILAGRRINDSMGKYVAEKTIKYLIKAGKNVKNAKVLIMGCTFKENVPDMRNSKVFDVINELREYEVDVVVSDSIVNEADYLNAHNVELMDFKSVCDIDAVVLTVPHNEYLNLDVNDILSKMPSNPILIDIKGALKNKAINQECLYWSL